MSIAFLFAYMFCQITSGPSAVAGGCAPNSSSRFAIANWIEVPVHATSQCFWEALFAALIAGALVGLVGLASRVAAGMAARAAAAGARGAGPGSGEPPLGEPFTDTNPDLGDTLDLSPYNDTLPGNPPAPQNPPGPGSPGPPGPGKPGLPPEDSGGDNSKYPWSWGEPPSPELQNAIDQMLEARQRLTDYVLDFRASGARGGGVTPEFLKLEKELSNAFKEWIKFRPGPIPPGVSPGGIPPPAPPPTGPTGTQIIGPKGPTGTQVIPGPASPTSPTQPQINCGGTPCVSPYDKTQAGINGVLNTLGQKSGG
jgi:hypothetical protein